MAEVAKLLAVAYRSEAALVQMPSPRRASPGRMRARAWPRCRDAGENRSAVLVDAARLIPARSLRGRARRRHVRCYALVLPPALLAAAAQ